MTTRLTDKRVHVDQWDNPNLDIVEFETDAGLVDIERDNDDGSVRVEIGFEEVGHDEIAALLDDVADNEYMPADALELARDIVSDMDAEDGEDGEDDEQEDEDEETSFSHTNRENHGEVVHTLDDGTEIRVGDKIQSDGNHQYRITARKGPEILGKMDATDDWGIVQSKVERDVREHGFVERWNDVD